MIDFEADRKKIAEYEATFDTKYGNLLVINQSIGSLLWHIKVRSAYTQFGSEDRIMDVSDLMPMWKFDRLGTLDEVDEMLNILADRNLIEYDDEEKTVRLIDKEYFRQRKQDAMAFRFYEEKNGKGSFTRGT